MRRSGSFQWAGWLIAALLIGCDGSGPEVGAGGSGGSGGGGGDPACAEAAKTASIGPEGGVLEHCGAKLEIPAGALGEAVSFGIEKVEPPGPAPFETEYTAGVFHFTPDDRDFAPGLGVFLPHGGAQGRVHLVVWSQASWQPIEACGVDDTHIQQTLSRLGTFAAVRDTIDWPDSTAGLGDGTLDYTFLGMTQSRSLDDGDGYAIYDQGEDGSRSYQLVFRKNYPDHLENFDIILAVPKSGDPELVQVTYIDTSDPSGGYSYVSAVHTGGVLTLVPDSGDRLKGTISATLHKGEVEEAFEGSFDVHAERYRYPPELACNGGPEG